jgi:hypothetical protein
MLAVAVHPLAAVTVTVYVQERLNYWLRFRKLRHQHAKFPPTGCGYRYCVVVQVTTVVPVLFVIAPLVGLSFELL